MTFEVPREFIEDVAHITGRESPQYYVGMKFLLKQPNGGAWIYRIEGYNYVRDIYRVKRDEFIG